MTFNMVTCLLLPKYMKGFLCTQYQISTC